MREGLDALRSALTRIRAGEKFLLPPAALSPLAVGRQRAARARRQAAQDVDAVQGLVTALRDRLSP